MDKEIKNLYPILKLLNEKSTNVLIKFLEPYIKNERRIEDNKYKKKIYTKRKHNWWSGIKLLIIKGDNGESQEGWLYIIN